MWAGNGSGLKSSKRSVASYARHMRVVVAADKFKGSLSSARVGEHLRRGILATAPNCDVVVVPMADGGEGTLDAALAAGYTLHEMTAHGPLGEPVTAHFAMRGDEAVIELARATGLELIPVDQRDPLVASSRGTGDLIRAALDAGAKIITLAVGGSASTDGGAGMLTALGARVLDESGVEVPPGGGALRQVASVDLSGLDPRVAETRFVLASDVDNPLLGPFGAVAVFARQKGADAAECAKLELGLTHFHRVLQREIGDTDHSVAAGAGAAGGVGYSALAALGADRWPGVEVVAAITRLRAHLAGADLAITGEGSIDEQTLAGKTPAGVAQIAAGLDVPVVAACGRVTLREDALQAAGFEACYATMDRAFSEATSLRDAGRLLEGIGADIARDFQLDRPDPESW